MIQPILTNPDQRLRVVAKNVNFASFDVKKYKKLIADMAETMLSKDGVGLAAPQIGRAERIIVINTKDGVLAFFNPELKNKSLLKIWEEEGCLSVPQVWGQVKRHRHLTLEAWNINGKKIELPARGMFARVLQHEVDHLDGILFIDKAKQIRTNKTNE